MIEVKFQCRHCGHKEGRIQPWDRTVEVECKNCGKFETAGEDTIKKEEVDASKCPKCGNTEDTIVYDESFGKQLWLCDTPECQTFYEVKYKVEEIQDIKIQEKRK